MIVEQVAASRPLPPVLEFPVRRLIEGASDRLRILLTTAAAGDVAPSAPSGALARARVTPGRWHMTRQAHGASVLCAQQAADGSSGDGLVAATVAGTPSAGVLAMFAADCALIGLASPEGVIGVAHCGWRGLEAGIVEEVAAAMRSLGASDLAAVRGPCIGPECYEFGTGGLGRLVERYGPSLASKTRSGSAALDLRAGVREAARRAGVSRLVEVAACTSCDPGWYSYRARRDTARFALAVTDAP